MTDDKSSEETRETRLCDCHNVDMLWHNDRRYTAKGYYYCRIKRKDYVRDKYDKDPIHRLGKLLRFAKSRRAKTLEKLTRRQNG